MATIFDLSSRITLDTETFKSKLDAARKDFIKTAKSIERTSYTMGRSFQNIGSGLTRLAIAPVAFIALTTRAFAEEEAAINQLEARLKSTNGVSGQTIESLTNMASALQAVTTFGDETIMEAQGLLLTFTKVKEVFPRATETVLDMSVALKQDLKSSAIQLGKALQDPIRGVTALRRVGVQLTAEQEDQIKGFVKANDILSAQTIILDELATQTAGAARKAADGLTGQMTQMKNVVGDLAEKIGMAFTPALSAITRKISELAPKIEHFVTRHQKLTVVIGTVVVAATALIGSLGLLATVIGSTLVVANGFAKFMAIKWVASMVAAASANGFFAVSLGPLAILAATVGSAFALLVSGSLRDYIRNMYTARYLTDWFYMAAKVSFDAISTAAHQLWDDIKTTMTDIKDMIKEIFSLGFADTDMRQKFDASIARKDARWADFRARKEDTMNATIFSEKGWAEYQKTYGPAKERATADPDSLGAKLDRMIQLLERQDRRGGQAQPLMAGVN